MQLIIGLSGASGVIYGIRLLEVLAKKPDIETHLVVSKAAEVNIRTETEYKVDDVKAMATNCYDVSDTGARLASGSFKRDGMIVAPCSVKTMAALAHSYNENLLVRAGDVTLKEGKKLILLVRETPFHMGHLENMARLCRMGATIMPPVPAFYHKPKTIDEIINHIVGKTLDMFDIEHQLFKRWSGLDEDQADSLTQ